MKQAARNGFTLIELVIVVAILAFIAAVAIGKYADVREAAAKKTNFASLASVQRTIETAIAHSDSVLGMFNYCDSLVTMASETEAATGPVTNYVWASQGNGFWAQKDLTGGVYAGQVVPKEVYDASGNGTGVMPTFEEIQAKNSGIPQSLRKMLGVYYLSDSEREALYKAGIGILSYHNPSSAQAYGAANRHPWYLTTTNCSGDDLAIRGGGPGFRPDMSAFYPVYMYSTEHPHSGLAVAVLNPASASSVYRALVSSKDYPNDKATLDQLNAGKPEDWFKWGLPRLVVIGLGKHSDTVSRWFESFPRDNTRGKTEYWNYCLVFQLNNGGRAGTDAKFVGAIDSRGNTVVGAENNMDWN